MKPLDLYEIPSCLFEMLLIDHVRRFGSQAVAGTSRAEAQLLPHDCSTIQQVREAERLGRGLINHICFEARRKDCLQVCPSSPRAACSTSAPAHTPEGRDAFKRGGWEGAGLSQSPLPMLPVRRFPEGWWCSPQPGLLCRTPKVYLWLLTVGIWVGVFWSINPDTYGRCKT